MLLQAEFLAIVLVLVYVGAVMVLFLFVVMMLDINIDGFARASGAPAAGRLVGALIALEMALVLLRRLPLPTRRPSPADSAELGNTKVLGTRSTPNTSTRCRSRRCCCWSRSSRRSR